jgi:hypothetical protein
MKRLFYILIWLVISLLAGVVGNYLFSVNFWIASLIAGLALIANGLITGLTATTSPLQGRGLTFMTSWTRQLRALAGNTRLGLHGAGR